MAVASRLAQHTPKLASVYALTGSSPGKSWVPSTRGQCSQIPILACGSQPCLNRAWPPLVSTPCCSLSSGESDVASSGQCSSKGPVTWSLTWLLVEQGMPQDTGEEEVWDLFSKWPGLVDVRMSTNRATRSSKGFAFLVCHCSYVCCFTACQRVMCGCLLCLEIAVTASIVAALGGGRSVRLC